VIDRAGAFQTRLLGLALDCGEPMRLARAFAFASCFAAAEGGRARRTAERLLGRAEALATRTGDPHALAWIPLARGAASFLRGAWRRAIAELGDAEARFGEHGRGISWELVAARTCALWALGYTGELRELSHRVSLGLADARARGDRFAEIHMRTGASHYVRLAKDDPEESRRESREALREWSHGGFYLQHLLNLFVQVESDLYEDRARSAHAALERAWPKLTRAMFLHLENARIFMNDLYGRAELAVAESCGGRRGAAPSSEARRLLASCEKRARRIEAEGAAWGEPTAATLLAGAARLRGDRRRAKDLLTRAEASFSKADMRLHAAAVAMTLGELVGGDEARASAARAKAWMVGEEIRNPERMVRMLVPGFGR
jgi:hypothetical protein